VVHRSLEPMADSLLPVVDAGDDIAATFDEWLARWFRSPAWASLLALTGQSAPDSTSLDDVVQHFARTVEEWDFRSGVERLEITKREAVVNGRVLPEAPTINAAVTLGLAHLARPAGEWSHIVVLGGTARACRNRSRFALELLREYPHSQLVALTADRPLAAAEQATARDDGWGELTLESEAAVAAVREVLQLPPPHDVAEGPFEAAPLVDDEQARRTHWSHLRWHRSEHNTAVDVVSAPSSEPGLRRANTADQLSFWSERVGLDRSANVLLVTTEHYGIYQQITAIRALALPVRCAVATVGVPWVPSGPFAAAGYLQELRSAVLAAAALRDALRAAGSTSS
jgi:hypothetical protein